LAAKSYIAGLRPVGFEEYFSGSPKLYPLLATIVDSSGGLVLALLVSLMSCSA
jgi:hypothetical protein